MSIEINGLPPPQSQATGEGSQVKVARGEPTSAQQQTGRPSSTDTVTLTEAAGRLQRLENTMPTLPVVDVQRVERIQQAIANGTYEVHPDRIADKLLQLEDSIFGKG